jgi:hypothetical protein
METYKELTERVLSVSAARAAKRINEPLGKDVNPMPRARVLSLSSQNSERRPHILDPRLAILPPDGGDVAADVIEL